MKALAAHKFHLLGVSLITILFFISVHVRQEKLALPLSPEFEWVTAHTLITLEIWDEAGGPQAYNFNPVYTYSGKGNEAIGTMGGVMSDDRKLYYTSYPPFSFIAAYYATKILGGPDVSSLRTFGLMMHYFCALLIYLILRKLRPHQKDKFCIAGVIGAGLYLFSAGTLWMHGIMYFADMLIQLLLLVCIYLLVRFFQTDYKNERLFLFGLGNVVFLCVYTEWLGLFFAFFVGIFFLLVYLLKKNKRYLAGFFAMSIPALLAFGLTLLQYSNIKSWDELTKVSQTKYEERSGNQENIEGLEVFNWENPRSYELMEDHFNRNFAMVINLSAVIPFFLIPILVWRKTREKIKKLKWKLLLLLLLLLSVLTHYLLFFNFNALHNFSNLKSGLLLILFITIVIQIIEETLNWKYNVVLSALLLFLIIPRAEREVRRFDNFYSADMYDIGLMKSAQVVNEYHDAEKLVFVDVFVTPAYIYSAHHNVFPIDDTSHAAHFMNYFQVDKAQFYGHEQNHPKYMLELVLEKEKVRALERINF